MTGFEHQPTYDRPPTSINVIERKDNLDRSTPMDRQLFLLTSNRSSRYLYNSIFIDPLESVLAVLAYWDVPASTLDPKVVRLVERGRAPMDFH